MKRVQVRLAAAVGGAFVFGTGVTLGIAVAVSQASDPPLPASITTMGRTVTPGPWPCRVPPDWPAQAADWISTSSVGRTRILAADNTVALCWVDSIRYGLPFRALAKDIGYTFRGQTGFTPNVIKVGGRELPARILWPGFIADVLIYAAVPVTLAYAHFWALRRKRRVEGRCPACGYDLRGLPGACPECGS